MNEKTSFEEIIKPAIKSHHIPWIKKLLITHEIQSLLLDGNCMLILDIDGFKKGKPIFIGYFVDIEKVKHKEENPVWHWIGERAEWVELGKNIAKEIHAARNYKGNIYYADWQYKVHKYDYRTRYDGVQGIDFFGPSDDMYKMLYMLELRRHKNVSEEKA